MFEICLFMTWHVFRKSIQFYIAKGIFANSFATNSYDGQIYLFILPLSTSQCANNLHFMYALPDSIWLA